jgi:hypothetical protein
VILDFTSGQDRIALSSSIYGGSALRFDAATNSLVWEGPTGNSGDDVLIATLTGVTVLTSSDYYFY